MEHLHHRFMAADGSGSDGMIAFEATEVASTHRSRTLVPVRPAEPLAGAPDRSPIPLADNVSDGVAAVQASAARARTAAGGIFARLVARLQDLLPRRRTAYRRVTPATARREMQRRAAVAVLAFVVVFGGLAGLVYTIGGQPPTGPLASVTAGEAAVRAIRSNLGQVFAPGVDLVVGDPAKAMDLLTSAYHSLDTAAAAGVPASTLDPLRNQVVGGLDRLFHVVPVAATTVLPLGTLKTPFDIAAIILGPDGMPYVLDRTTASVYRVDLRAKRATLVFRSKLKAAGAIEGVPKLLATGGRDLVIVDDKNVVWRWRAADTKGAGTTTRIFVEGAPGWGNDVVAIGTFIRGGTNGLYNLYVVDPSEQNIQAYYPDSDGGGFHSKPQARLTVARDVSKVTGLLIDGDIFVVDDGAILRFVGGDSKGWDVQPPGITGSTPDGDTLLRPAPRYTLIASASDKRIGSLYAWDRLSARVVALDKAQGTFVEQYRLAGGNPAWQDVRGMYVVLGASSGAPSTLIWATKDTVMSAVLVGVPDEPRAGSSASPSPSGSAVPTSPRPSARATARPSSKATATP
jgi:hypothetical protein